MNVLSLFDGMSCGQIALSRCGHKVDNYLSCEIDKYAIYITQKNFPKTNNLGGVINVNLKTLPRIDVLMGGSPCQGFSFAGKQLNFDDERSKLFFEYLRIKDAASPKYFFLENVKMKKEYEDIITQYMGVQPIKINSKVVCAQSRDRVYWTNIPMDDIGDISPIKVKDILDGPSYKIDKSLFIDTSKVEYVTLDQHKSNSGLICVGGLKSDNVKLWDPNAKKVLQRNFSQGARVYSIDGKGCTLNAQGGGWGAKTGLYLIDGKVRKLSVTECERMQTVPNGYLAGLSNPQALKLLGNGWTVDVICKFFKNIQTS